MQKKTNIYPLSDDIRHKMGGYWSMLEKKKLIDGAKYQRLISSRPLTQEQIDGFCNRQLVNTSQAVKCVGELLLRYFSKFKTINTKIVYSRAEIVSKFRKGFKIYKSRIVNDLHHAHDAYLNIVVGNVWYNIFTKPIGAGLNENRYSTLMGNDTENDNPKTYDDKKFSSVMRIFCRCRAEHWSIDYLDKIKSYTVRSSEKYVNKFPVSIMPHEYVGAFYDQTTHIKSDGGIQLKEGLDPKKYGCYRNVHVKYIMVIEYKNVKTNEVSIHFCKVPSIYAELKGKIDNDLWLKKICDYNELKICNISSIRIIYSKLLINHLLEINHVRFLIKDGDLNCISDCQWYPSENILEIVKSFENFYSRLLTCNTQKDQVDPKNFTEEKSKILFDAIINQLKKNFYRKYKFCDKLHSNKLDLNLFEKLSIVDRCYLINQLLIFINGSYKSVNTILIGGVKEETCRWRNPIPKKIKDKLSVSLICQSVTGLFEKKFSLIENL